MLPLTFNDHSELLGFIFAKLTKFYKDFDKVSIVVPDFSVNETTTQVVGTIFYFGIPDEETVLFEGTQEELLHWLLDSLALLRHNNRTNTFRRSTT